MGIHSYKLKNGETRYTVEVYVGGKRIAQKRGFKKKSEAKNYMAEVLTRGEAAAKRSITYGEVEKLYLESAEQSMAGSSVYTIENTLKNNVPAEWHERAIKSITPKEAQELCNAMAARTNSARYYAERIADVFKYAVDMDFLQKSPFAKVVKPKKAASSVDEKWAMWTPDEYARFFDAVKKINPIAYPLFRTILYTGTRRGESVAIRWQDFDYENRVIYVRNAFGLDRNGHRRIKEPKNDSRRAIPIDQETAGEIESLRHTSASEFIFNINYATVYNWFLKAEKMAGLPHSRIHNLRAEHCTVLLQNGAYVKDVQMRLGHKTAQTTLNTYARASKNQDAVLSFLPENHYTHHYKDD